jgi:NTP pyrophosphatase (non-canonical NTP hydrolase)
VQSERFGALRAESRTEARMADLQQTLARIRAFRDARDWMQFHNPKNLACSIVIEAAELLELFQWKTPAESELLVETKRDLIAHEMADIAVYLLELADNLGIDLLDAIDRKMTLNEAKYPVEKAKGSSAKYTELR